MARPEAQGARRMDVQGPILNGHDGGGTDAEAAARRAWRLVLDAAGEALTTPGLPPDDRADLLDLWRGAAEIAQRPCLSLLSRAGGPLR